MKKTLILLLAAFMLLGFAACDTESTNDNSSADSVEASVDNSTESSAESEDNFVNSSDTGVDENSDDLTFEEIDFTAHRIDAAPSEPFKTTIIDSSEGLLAFKDKYYTASTVFDEEIKAYNDVFFEEKALILVHKAIWRVCPGCDAILNVYYDNNKKTYGNCVLVSMGKDPYGEHDEELPIEKQYNWLYFIEVNKSDIEGYTCVGTNLVTLPIVNGELSYNSYYSNTYIYKHSCYPREYSMYHIKTYEEYLDFYGKEFGVIGTDKHYYDYSEKYFELNDLVVVHLPIDTTAQNQHGVMIRIDKIMVENGDMTIYIRVIKLDEDMDNDEPHSSSAIFIGLEKFDVNNGTITTNITYHIAQITEQIYEIDE